MRTVTVGTLFEVVVVSTNSAFPPSKASDIDMEILRKRSGDDTTPQDELDDSVEEDKHATKADEEGRGIVKRAAAVRILDLAYNISSSYPSRAQYTSCSVVEFVVCPGNLSSELVVVFDTVLWTVLEAYSTGMPLRARYRRRTTTML
eukprot:scaffold37488_cov49-Attheya_sp.AAC.8